MVGPDVPASRRTREGAGRDGAGGPVLAAEQGLLEHADVKPWEDAVDAAAADGWFLYAFSLFITTGRVAPHRP